MNIDDFIKLFTNIPSDFDGYYGVQCMDLMHFYKYICLGIHDKTTLAAPTAVQVWDLNYPQLFEKIKNAPTNFPLRGDIIIWGKTVGSAGHIAVVNKADVNSFESFDANWPVGSNPHLQAHDYTGVLGWLHPLMSLNTEVELENLRKELEYEISEKERFSKLADEYKETCTSQSQKIAELGEEIKTDNQAIAEYRSEIASLQQQFADVSRERDGLLDVCKGYESSIFKLKGDNEALSAILASIEPLKEYKTKELVNEILSRIKYLFVKKAS